MKNAIYRIVWVMMLMISCDKNDDYKIISRTRPENNITFTLSQMKEMSVEEVRLMPMAEEFTAVGEVSFDEDNVVRIYPIVSGTVVKVNVSLGDYVHRGQLLALLLSTDITTFQRDYKVAKANLEVAEKNMNRANDLYTSGMMSEKDFTEAKKEYMNAISDFNEKKQILELYGVSPDSLDAVFRVVAPNSGYIVERSINEGTQIRSDNNTPIFILSDLKTIWVWANVHESDMAKIKVGDKVSVNFIAYPDKVFYGQISTIGTMLDEASRVIRVRMELNNENGLLKPGMFATVTITSSTNEKVIAIPQRALVLENNNYYVMREVKDNAFEKVQITIGKKFGDFVEITSGLKVGERIIVNGALFAVNAYNLK